MRNDFGVIIISHGRPECETVKTLRASGYSGNIYIVVDDEDNTKDEYIRLYGDHVHIFHKTDNFDLCDLGGSKKSAVYARNECIKVAEKQNLTYYLELDDDFSEICFRYAEDDKLQTKMATDLDVVFGACLELLKTTPITWLSFGLSSDYIGGVENDRFQSGMFRKTMGSFFMKAEDKVKFTMRMNDDITTCVLNGMRGKLFYTLSSIMVITPATQHMGGGMTDIYKLNGTYRKSFYSVMSCPSCVKVSAMGIKDFRIHHEIKWNNAVPKLLNERWCKHD